MLSPEYSKDNLVKDSNFAFGSSMMAPKICHEIEPRDFDGRSFEVLNYMDQAAALTITAVTTLLEQNRGAASRSLNALWYAGIVKWMAVSGNNSIFKLWITADSKPPKTPNDACRLAAFGFYYSLAKKEVPGFGWRLIYKANTPLLAEMTYTSRGGQPAKMIIDAPRRGEKPWPDANVYIFPTLEEAQAQTPAGKLFTSDLLLLENDGNPLSERMYEMETKKA